MEYIDKAKTVLQTFLKHNGRMPSFSELAKLMEYKSKNSVFKLVNNLEETGFVKQDQKGKIIPGENWFGLRMLGLVEAGFPSPAEEDNADVISLDEFLIDNRESSFILKVKGDSMIDAGIHNGDLVIADRGREAKNGNIVIADIDGGWTMKYLREKNGIRYLEAANPDYCDIFPEEELKIGAVVVSVIRKY